MAGVPPDGAAGADVFGAEVSVGFECFESGEDAAAADVEGVGDFGGGEDGVVGGGEHVEDVVVGDFWRAAWAVDVIH